MPLTSFLAIDLTGTDQDDIEKKTVIFNNNCTLTRNF